MNKKEIEIGEFEMHLKKFFVCALIQVIMTISAHKAGSENGCGK